MADRSLSTGPLPGGHRPFPGSGLIAVFERQRLPARAQSPIVQVSRFPAARRLSLQKARDLLRNGRFSQRIRRRCRQCVDRPSSTQHAEFAVQSCRTPASPQVQIAGPLRHFQAPGGDSVAALAARYRRVSCSIQARLSASGRSAARTLSQAALYSLVRPTRSPKSGMSTSMRSRCHARPGTSP